VGDPGVSNVRVGVIGAGVMGADHVLTLHRYVAGATVTAVTDIDAGRAAAAVAGVPGARVIDHGFALITDPQVDAVVIASHDDTHADLAVAAVAAGKPVMCEKPLAPTVEESLRVLRAERSAGGGLIGLGFMRRFDPGYTDLKAALRSGAYGAPLLAHCISRGVSSGPGANSELSVTGSAIHEFDTMPWLLDSPIVEVGWYAPRATAAVTGWQDPQVMHLRTADGVLSTVETFLNAGYGYDIRCEVVAERGTLALAEPARVTVNADRSHSTGYALDWRPRFADAYRLELQEWIDAVTAGRPSTLATAADGVIAAATAAAVIESMRSDGRVVPVRIPEI
jgi:myo-inositol 2-dehydrogenase / D-chiro-inositol 1-dehydrogenase